MDSMFLYLLALSLPLACVCNDKIYGYVLWGKRDVPDAVLTATNLFSIPNYYAARATYHNDINNTGWAYLELHTTEGVSDERQAFAAGYLEGYLTKDLIWKNWINTMGKFCDGRKSFCDRLENYTATNYWFIQDMVNKMAKTNGSDPYWHHINLIYLQLKGLHYGYKKAAPKTQTLTFNQFMWLNMVGDMEDLQTILGGKENNGKAAGNNRCSALIKLLEDGSDIIVAHTTWTVYETMLRIQKKYVFNYHVSTRYQKRIPGRSVSMSSYPGLIHSADDFYVLSSGLVTLETTISNDNSSLWPLISPNGQVLEFIRTTIANRLASDGKQWTNIFRKYNSGTYNNQWMVVNYKRFTPESKGKLKSDVLWVLEQLPGYVEASDLTHLLESQLYFPSYNTPYFTSIFNMSGQIQNVEKFGDWFTYDKNPRALIFKRDQDKVKSVDDMLQMIRYNDFKHDPLSRCNCTPPYSGENAIGARSDLNPANGTYAFAALGHRNHGASDAKITNLQMANKLQFKAVSSPPFNEAVGILPFRWSTADFGDKVSHLGHPDLWNFSPLVHEWEW